jgi:ABC-type polysaccharide/polyol phosphate export permease
VLGAAFHFAVALVLVILLTWGFRGFGNVPVLLSLVPSILLLLVMGWSLAVLSGFASVIFPDMKHLLDIGLQLVFYATPIIYPGDAMQEKGLSWLMKYNPVPPSVAQRQAAVAEQLSDRAVERFDLRGARRNYPGAAAKTARVLPLDR